MAKLNVYWLASAGLQKEELEASGRSNDPRRCLEIDLEKIESPLRAPLLELTTVTGHSGRGGDVTLQTIRLRRVKRYTGEQYAPIKEANFPLEAAPEVTDVAGLAATLAALNTQAVALRDEAEERVRKAKNIKTKTYKIVCKMMRDVAGDEERPLLTRLSTLRGFNVEAHVYDDYPLDFSPKGNLYSLAKELAVITAKVKTAYWKAEKSEWIALYGSEHLKRATLAGYNCQRLYVREHAAAAAPGFIADFDDAANWKSRSCPSPEALDVAAEAGLLGLGSARVVWLIHPPDAEWPPGLKFEQCEAVVIREFLGCYDLVRTV